MISWGATKYYPGGHGTFIGILNWILRWDGKEIINNFQFFRCCQFIRAHHYVHLLFTCRNGSAISKIFVVEKVYNKYADGTALMLIFF